MDEMEFPPLPYGNTDMLDIQPLPTACKSDNIPILNIGCLCGDFVLINNINDPAGKAFLYFFILRSCFGFL